jgi:hypothetical protein
MLIITVHRLKYFLKTEISASQYTNEDFISCHTARHNKSSLKELRSYKR